MSDGQLILVAGALLATALAAALLAGRLRVPGLLLFLGLGMIIGSDGTGWIKLDDYELARRVGSSPWRPSSSRAGSWPASPRSGRCCGPD